MRIHTAWRARGLAAALFLGLVPLLGVGNLQAAEGAGPEPIAATLTLHRVVTDAEGVEQLEPADAAKPGDLLEYRVVYVNSGDVALGNVFATLPIPEGLVYEAGTARPDTAVAATGDGEFAAVPLVRSITDSAGNAQTVPVPLAEYRALRWVLGTLEPGASADAAARVRVADVDRQAAGDTP